MDSTELSSLCKVIFKIYFCVAFGADKQMQCAQDDIFLFSFCYQFDEEPTLYREILDMFNTIFTFMFTGEAILKLFAFRTVSLCTGH